jgi:hypothetical protein
MKEGELRGGLSTGCPVGEQEAVSKNKSKRLCLRRAYLPRLDLALVPRLIGSPEIYHYLTIILFYFFLGLMLYSQD